MRRGTGVSLVEILVVVLVVAGALIPIFGLMTSNARQVAFNSDRAVALVLATQVAERYRHERFSDIETLFATPEIGAATLQGDPILNELAMGIPESMESLYFKFTRVAWFEPIEPGLLGKLMIKVTWTSNQDKFRVFHHPVLLRNEEYHHGKP